jgi:hypothetical protein
MRTRRRRQSGGLAPCRFGSRRHGDDDLRRLGLAKCLYRGQHAGTGRQTVVDEDDSLTGDVDGGPTAAVCGLAPDQLAALAFGDFTELLGCDPQRAQHVVVDHHTTAEGHGSRREFIVSGRAELANHERVERGAERRRHLPGHGAAAPRQPEDQTSGLPR